MEKKIDILHDIELSEGESLIKDHINVYQSKEKNNYLIKYDLQSFEKIDEYYIINDGGYYQNSYFSVDSALYYQSAHKIFSIKPNTKWK